MVQRISQRCNIKYVTEVVTRFRNHYFKMPIGYWLKSTNRTSIFLHGSISFHAFFIFVNHCCSGKMDLSYLTNTDEFYRKMLWNAWAASMTSMPVDISPSVSACVLWWSYRYTQFQMAHNVRLYTVSFHDNVIIWKLFTNNRLFVMEITHKGFVARGVGGIFYVEQALEQTIEPPMRRHDAHVPSLCSCSSIYIPMKNWISTSSLRNRPIFCARLTVRNSMQCCNC